MRRIYTQLKDLEPKSGELIVIYRGIRDFPDSFVITTGNIKRDKVVKKIFSLIVNEY